MVITQDAVINAIAEKLHQAFPEWTIYVNQQEQEFTRPSLFIDPVYWDRERTNIGTDLTTFYVTVYCFEKLTVNRNGDLFTALQTANQIEALFRMETLPVGDRVLKIQTSRGSQERGECDVDMVISWYDWNGFDPDARYPLMKQLHTRMDAETSGGADR